MNSNRDNSRRILLTGFEAFGLHEVNPSQQVVEVLAGEEFAGIALDTAVLPVEYAACDEALRALIAHHQPEIALCLGVANRDYLSLERVALNLDDAGTPDNAGEVRLGMPIREDGPAAYITDLQLFELREVVVGLGLPVQITNHAGAYLCNHAYYTAAHAFACQGKAVRCLFIHVPPLAIPWPDDPARLWTLDDLCQAARAVLHYWSR